MNDGRIVKMDANSHAIASAFVDARRSGRALASYPGNPPQGLAEAYAIQDKALSIWDRAIGGWKVGKINPPASTQLGSDRLSGPVFTDSILNDTADKRTFPVFAGGFAAAEAEFALKLRVLDEPLPQNNEAARRWVEEIRIGVEVASSPYPDINADGPCVTVSDHGNNAGLLLGPLVPEAIWGELNSITVSLDIDGETAGTGSVATMLDGPFGAVRFLLKNLTDRGIALETGWWISSGAITGVHEVNQGAQVTARFEGLGEISLQIT